MLKRNSTLTHLDLSRKKSFFSLLFRKRSGKTSWEDSSPLYLGPKRLPQLSRTLR
jgi:hypothetical protein